MDEDKEDIRDVIIEELNRLGVKEIVRKKMQGSKLLGINTSCNRPTKQTNNSRTKNKFKKSPRRSPRLSKPRSPYSKTSGTTNPNRDERKQKLTPKSPFASAKRRAEQRKQNAKVSSNSPGQVFGQRLENIPSVCVYLNDGTQVTVAEFLVDICNLIRRNITVEGIFRKAGSSQRQSDLKKLINSCNALPTNVHVIDGACLLKQFLRSFPEPLLSSDLHSKIVKCMELAEELRIEAITLCTLLLPEAHRYTLIYLLDFLKEVVAASESNFMDAHNLAIVLAPNLLPTTITPTSRKNFQSVPSEDSLLTTNIEIVQLMIENASRICRMPANLVLALEHREQSKSTENLLTVQANSAPRKKRRSASIHRLMTGLRRVVGHASGSGSPLRASDSTEYLDTLHGIALSPAPMPILNVSPRKRKSADAFDLHVESQRAAAADAHHISTPPTSKRVKVDETEVGVAGACTTPSSATNLDTATSPVFCENLPITVFTCATPSEKSSSKVGQPITIRKDKNSPNVFTQLASREALMDDTRSKVKEPFSSEIRTLPKSPGFGFHNVHRGLTRRSLDRIDPMGQNNQEKGYPRAYSQLTVETAAKVGAGNVRRRSCDVPLTGGVKRACSFEETVRVVRRNAFERRLSGNEPDGADVSTLGPRGIPDGAECNLRDGALPQTTVGSSVESLEQHYDDIKAVVKTMEAEVDKTNVEQMKEVFFADSSSSQNMSYSEMIQNAYERMKVETKDLSISPSQSLSKRLGKELKIRKRRSSEHRVIRSPSERKIGTIRRRSRELVQNAAKSTITVEDTPKTQPMQTPKMKEHLIQTPVNGSLRRGKPNSVKSGLPFVVRSFSPLKSEETPLKSTNRMVVVSKRVDMDNVVQPMKSLNRSPYQQNSSHDSNSSYFDSRGSMNELPSLNVSNQSSDELMNSILELVPGPMTRRRSSLLSSMTTEFPLLKLSSENLNSDEMIVDDGSSSSNHSGNIVSESDNYDNYLNSCNHQLGKDQPVVVLPEEEVEEWVPACNFDYAQDDLGLIAQDINQGRPSLCALKKQKKVTANVQLFNNLHSVAPPRQGHPYIRSTPQRGIPLYSTASERRNARLNYSKSLNNRCTMTPRELLKARQRSFQFDRSPMNLAKIAVVSPLKESTWINIQKEHAHEVPKAFKGEATVPQSPGFPERSSKPPFAPVTPVRPPSQLKAFAPKLESSSSNPPKLPPRAGVKPSPIRVQYR